MKELADAFQRGKQVGLLDLCHPLPSLMAIENWPGTSPKTKEVVAIYQKALSSIINDWLQQRQYAKFDAQLSELRKAEHACQTGDSRKRHGY